MGANVGCGTISELDHPVFHNDLGMGWTAKAHCLNDTRTFSLIPTFKGQDGKSEEWTNPEFTGFDGNQPSLIYGGGKKNREPSE